MHKMSNKKITIIVLVALIRPIDAEDRGTETNKQSSGGEEFRSKRQLNTLPLVFPYGGTYKFIIAVGMPIKTENGINLGFAVNFQYQYTLYTNISDLSQYYFIKDISREQRDLDLERRRDERLTFYKAVVSLMHTKGMNGEDCLLRAICEAAQFPVQEEGLVGEIMHILLTPDYGRTFLERDPIWEESMSVYTDAAVAGRQMFSCPYIYPGCPEGQGFLELVTTLRDE